MRIFRPPRNLALMALFVAGAALVFIMLISFSEAAGTQETSHFAFVSEYVRELATNEDDRALGEKEIAEIDRNQTNARLVAGIRGSTRISLDLSTEIGILKTMHLNPPFEELTGNIIEFYHQKIGLHQTLIDISTKLLSGPQPGVDYGSLTAQPPQITARLEFIDRSLFQATPLIFATLIDTNPDKEGHLSHLIITRAQRDFLVKNLETSFGNKLNQRDQNYIVGSAAVLRDYLVKKGYQCADEP